MSNSENTTSAVPKKAAPGDEMEAKLVAVYEAATTEDRAQVAELVQRAKGAKPSAQVVTLEPGAAAILFHDHNKQNREWSWRTTQEYVDEIQADRWQFTNAGIGFLTNGEMGDGQHRVAAIAVSGQPLTVTVTFGMKPEAIIAIDTGKRRMASDFLDIKKVENSKVKQTIVKQAYGYAGRFNGNNKLRTNRDVVEAIQEHAPDIDEAIRIGEKATSATARPVIKLRNAQSLALLCLMGGRPASHVLEQITLLQAGVDTESEDSPLFVAGKILGGMQDSKTEKISTNKTFAVALKAFQLREEGAKAASKAVLRAAMKSPKAFPDPTYRQLA